MAEISSVSAINYVERIRTACDTWLEAGGVAARLAIGWAEANNARTMDAALLSAEDRLNADRRHERPSSDGGAGAEDGVAETEPADAEA